MRKRIIKILSLYIVFCLLLAGCGAAAAENDSSSRNTEQSTAPSEANVSEAPAVAEGEQTMSDTPSTAEGEQTMSDTQDPEGQKSDSKEESEELETMLQMKIGKTPVEVEWENNESVEALKELCQNSPLTISMSMYGGFEQVGPIGQSLPRNDSQTTMQAGDIVLYSGNQIVVFYGSNSWAYTRLGRITDKSAQEMTELLGNGDITITIEMG